MYFILHVKCSKWTKKTHTHLIVGLFLVWCSYKIAKKYYTEDCLDFSEISKTLYIPLQNSPQYGICIFNFDDIAIPILTGF